VEEGAAGETDVDNGRLRVCSVAPCEHAIRGDASWVMGGGGLVHRPPMTRLALGKFAVAVSAARCV
jgi:hypothetical protein